MKSLFGKYLVDCGLVSEVEMAVALIELMKKSPLPAEVLMRERIISARELLDVMDHQANNNTGFIDSAKALGLWSSEVEILFTEAALEESPTLIEILVTRGFASVEKLVEVLDKYLAHTPKEETVAKVEKEEELLSFKSERNIVDQIISQESGAIEDEIARYFNSDSLKTLLILGKEASLGELSLQIKKVRGMAYLAGLEKINLILHAVITIIKKVEEQQEGTTLAREIFSDSIILAWALAEARNRGQGEEEYISNIENSQCFALLLRKMNKCKRSLM